MSVSAEEIEALADAVSMWRTQEYAAVSVYVFYIYYVLTTIHEEVSIIFPQKWNLGKWLFFFIRYGICVHVAVQLARNYRNYFFIDIQACKAMAIIQDAAFYVSIVACNICLALCLSALLQAKRRYLFLIAILCVSLPIATAVFRLVSDFQYPAEPLSPLDVELGYPCYAPSFEEWNEYTIDSLGIDIRSYINLATTTVLFVLSVTVLFMRYKGQHGRLVQVMLRDGGIYYFALTALRFGFAVFNTPAVMPVNQVDSNVTYIVFNTAATVIVPILAQRLMINMRKVDYMGSRPFASKLLFARPQRGSSESSLEGEYGDDEFSESDVSTERSHGQVSEGGLELEAEKRRSREDATVSV